MPVLKDVPGYESLPELFSIIGHERLIDLCKYAGGETIKIPTLEELSRSIQSIQCYYSCFIEKSKPIGSIPYEYIDEVLKIKKHAEGL